jgi:hypothetical protein
MKNNTCRLTALFFSLILTVAASSSALGSATITINNINAAGVGFNDTTPAAPVGGNPGTTLGQQRLFAFTYAANIWGATLTSTVPIVINAQMTPLTCTSTSAVLGSAGAANSFRDFGGAPFAGTWYSVALANKLFGSDLDAANADINANFNSNLGNPGCLDGSFFYLGVDGAHGTNIDFVEVLEHEMAHGLGFATVTNASTGAQALGFPSIYDRFLIDGTSGKSWLQMTNAERAASSLNTQNLAWDGPKIIADVPSVLSLGTPLLKINSPAGIAGNYLVGTASFGAALTAAGVTGNVVQALDPADAAGPLTTDGCEALTNAAAVAGNIAIIDRGTCGFTVKVKNAQDAGAIAVIIADNVAGSPPAGLGGADATVTIPSVRVTLADANTIKANLGAGVNATMKLDTTQRAGADRFGKALLYTPNPFQSGSSVSHWDISAFPNQLMEPVINADLTQSVMPPQDLTFSQLSDIGWVASALPSVIAKTAGDNQNTAQNAVFIVPPTVTVSPAVPGITVTWTVNPAAGGASASFGATGKAAVSTTNALGVATAPTLTANGTPGQLGLNATAPGAGTTSFVLQIDQAPVAGASCLTDTTQADFAAGTANNTDVNTSAGNVTLLNPANPDQSQLVASSSGTGLSTTQWLGQTFVAGVTGNLQKIDMSLFCSACSGTDQPITVEIRTTTGSPALPTSTVLATTTLAGFSSGTGATYTAIFASPPTLTAGTTYAYTLRIVTSRTGTYAAIFGNAATDYATGDRVVSINSGASWSVPTSTGIARDLVFTTYMQTGFAASADFTSSLKDSNPPGFTFWQTMSWNATVPANTSVKFQAAGSNSFGGPFNFVGPDGTAATFFANGGSLSQFNGQRYLKYKAFLTTTDGTVTPAINDVTVCYNNALSPTAAEVSISGRVLVSTGIGVRGAVVSITDMHGIQRNAITNAFGYYSFDGVQSGESYVMRASARRFTFGTRVLNISDSLSDIDFVDGQ